MQKCHIRNPKDALLYITDCNLATVSSMAMKKSRTKYEFERQISIAQVGVDNIRDFHINPAGTRVHDILVNGSGSVEDWVQQYIQK